MSTQTIPAQTVVTCDCCKVTCTRSLGPGRRVAEGRLTIKQHALDYLGDPAADGSLTLDLCDSCLFKINTAINAVAIEIRRAKE